MTGTPVPFNKNAATTESLAAASKALGDISELCKQKRTTSPEEVVAIVRGRLMLLGDGPKMNLIAVDEDD